MNLSGWLMVLWYPTNGVIVVTTKRGFEGKPQDWERAIEVEKMTFLFVRKSEVIERKNILWRLLNKVLVPVIQKKEDFDT